MAKSKQTDVPSAIPLEKEKAKKECPITRQQFLKAAKALMVTTEGQVVAASVKEFSTGSFGWYATGRIVVTVDGVPCPIQVGMNLTVIESKKAK